jgi:rSAM/selenodomain-associated transferase 2
MPPRLSIVMPVLNEAGQLPARLGRLGPLCARGIELIVVDGGSDDDSARIAGEAGAQVIIAERGRARQMNAGADAARGEVVLFLHADTDLPAGADLLVVEALARSGRAWGRFDVDIVDGPRILSVVARMMNLRSRLSGIATGDQAIFVRREAFAELGGFPDQPLMEDVELSRRLKRVSPPLCLRERVTTSGRRWATRGTARTIVLMWRLRLAYWLGTSPERLAERYR